MPTPCSSSAVKKITRQWNGRDLMERLKLIQQNRELFRSLHLVTDSELNMADQMSESALEYILEREDAPIFTSINLKKTVGEQLHLQRFLIALKAVFL